MAETYKNYLWYTILPILRSWLVPSQIEKLEEFKRLRQYSSDAVMNELVAQMIFPLGHACTRACNQCTLVCEEMRARRMRAMTQNIQCCINETSFLTKIQENMQHYESKKIKEQLQEIVNWIKCSFHMELVNETPKKIQKIIHTLLVLSPIGFRGLLINIVYLPIWISLNKNSEIFTIPENHVLDIRTIHNLEASLNCFLHSARLYRLHRRLVKKINNLLLDNFNKLWIEINQRLYFLSYQLKQ